MQKDKWASIKSIFNRANELPQSEQIRFVSEQAKGDAEIQEKVLAMLQATATHIDIEQSSTTETKHLITYPTNKNIEKIVSNNASNLVESTEILNIGTVIEQFKVISLIGEGGMGSVFLGQRTQDDFDQLVAIKVVHKRHSTEQTIQRFKRERQILASLNHNNIASFIGGGQTDKGQPYIILEYVKGVPITEYCQQQNLTINARLALFRQVLLAVKYAHQNLVVHRDLKPNNVLVTASGDVKLLDFGIAKLIQQNDQSTDLTQQQMRVLTPSNASPEQVLGENVSTRSDVYGLGTLLMHLLTDEPVYDLSDKSSRDIEAMILEQTPIKPSIKCSESKHTRIKRRASQLKGDLDTIVMKALQKDPERRYSSVEQLLEDIQRYQSNYPITAKPDSMLYRAGKFVQRNSLTSGITAILVCSLTVFTVVVFYQSNAIEVQRDRAVEQAFLAEQTAEFMTDMFKAARPDQDNGEDISAKSLLENALQDIDHLQSTPSIKAKLLVSFATVYTQLDEFEKSKSLLTKAMILQSQISEDDFYAKAITRIDINIEMAGVLMLEGHYEQALVQFTKVINYLDEISQTKTLSFEEEISYYKVSHYELSNALGYMGKTQEAAIHSRLSIDYAEKSKEVPVPLIFYIGHAQSLREITQYAESVSMLEKAIALARAQSAAPSLDLAYGLNQLAASMELLGDIDGALVAAKEGFDIRTNILGEGHIEAIASAGMVSNLYSAANDVASAIAVRERLSEKILASLNETHPYYAINLVSLSTLYKKEGRFEEAKPALIRAHKLLMRIFEDGHYEVSRPLILLAEIALRERKVGVANAYLLDAMQVLNEELEGDSYLMGLSLGLKSLIKHAQGNSLQARSILQQALAMFTNLYGEDSKRYRTLVKTLEEITLLLALPNKSN